MRKVITRAIVAGLVVACFPVVGAEMASATDPSFRLPFEPGRQFQITQGPAQHAAGLYPEYNRHAVDFAMPVGTPVLAAAAGTIQFEGYDSTGAIQARIDHGSDRCSQYVHLSSTIINKGQKVQRGQLIGYSGNTGISSGAHLHFNMVNCSTQISREVVNTLEMGTSYPVALSAKSQNSKAPVGNNPQGSFDSASSPAPGRLRVHGWAFDRDALSAGVDIHVYIGGPSGVGEGRNLGPATVSRPDVNKAYPGVGNNHGFDVSFDHRAGTFPVFVYAINRTGTGGSNVLLGSRTVTVSNPNPIGNLDKLVSPQRGELHVGGWTLDPSDKMAALQVHIYVGGPAGTDGAEFLALGPADGVREDVGKAHPGSGSRHGFEWSFPTKKSGEQAIFVYSINVGPGANALIGSGSVDIAPGPPSISALTRPKLVGRAKVGRVLRVQSNAWDVEDVRVSYRWMRNGRPIKGATGMSYKVRKKDRQRRLSVRVVAAKPGYVAGTSITSRVKVAGKKQRKRASAPPATPSHGGRTLT